MFRQISFIIVSLLLLVGCQSPFEFRSEKEIKQEVLGTDASFAEILNKKTVLDGQIRNLKAEFNSKRKQISSKLLELKKELSSDKKHINSKIKEIKSEFSPYCEELRQKIKGLVTELKLKESSLIATNKTIAKFSRLIRKDTASEDLAKEAPRWRDTIASLKVQTQELEKEVSSIRDRIRLNRLKLKLLR